MKTKEVEITNRVFNKIKTEQNAVTGYIYQKEGKLIFKELAR